MLSEVELRAQVADPFLRFAVSVLEVSSIASPIRVNFLTETAAMRIGVV